MNTPFEMKEGRSGTYLGTVDHKSRTGKLIVEAMRREWKRRGNLEGKGYRVVLKGRMGKDNPNAFKYSVAAKPKWSWSARTFGSHSHQTIRLDDAAHADIYVYRRYA